MSRHKIMVVEDEAIVADDIAASLEDMGYAVTSVASSGEDAILFAERDLPDLVLMDIFLKGGIDGIDAADHIRTRLNIPVIYVTAYADKDILERAKITEPFGYIVKPFNNRDLNINISMALYKAEMERRLKVMEKELNKARKLEAAALLAKGVAHDFNNLLYIIMGNITLAKESEGKGKNFSKYLSTAENTILTTKDLIKKFITFATGGELYIFPVMISGLIDAVCKDFSQHTSITFRKNIKNKFSKIDADYQQLQQALDYIIENALEHMNPDDGFLDISVDNVIHSDKPDNFCLLKECEYVRINIKDNGSGIRKEDIDKVFDPYFSTKERGIQKGMGLGLTIAHSIIAKHNGFIEINSELAKGTEVSIYLPVSDKCSKLSEYPGKKS